MPEKNNKAKKKIFIIAAEPSGDLIGSKVIKALREKNKNLQIYGIGGQNMAYQGIRSLVPIQHLSLMGFMEVVPHMLKLRKIIKYTTEQIRKFEPDLVITIDSPGFNFRVVKALRNMKCKSKFAHIVAPSVWAYNPGRAKKVAEIYDLLLTLLPFEPPMFRKHGLDTEFIGHPIFEQNFQRNSPDFRRKYNIPNDHELICVTLGSRSGEIKKHIGIFTKTLQLLKNKYKIFAVFPIVSKDAMPIIKKYVGKSFNYTCIIGNEKLDVFAASDVALAKSGTNILEILACRTPAVVGYKVNFFTYIYVKLKIMIKYVSLVNIIANKEIVPEFIQDKCTPRNLANAIAKYLENDRLAEIQVDEANKVMNSFGFHSPSSPSKRAAEILNYKFLS